MTRKQRYWVCNECGLVWHRRLHDRAFFHCGILVRAARKYPEAAWRKHQRLAEKRVQERAKLERRHAVPRTCYGYRLRLSKETRKIFREVVTAKQRRSFQKRALAFIRCLREDIWTCPHQHGGTERECKCTGGGLVGAPAVSVYEGVSQGFYTRRTFHGRYGISIAWIDRIETLLHEAAHYIDDMSKADEFSQVGSHSRSFYGHIADLKKQLGWPSKRRYGY